MLLLVHTVATMGADEQSARYRCHPHGTFYVRLGFGDDGIAWDVSAALRRSTRIASTALMMPVSSKSVQIAMSHEPRSGHKSQTSYHVAP